MADFPELDKLRSIEELSNEQTNVRSQIKALETEFEGLPFPPDKQASYASLRATDGEIDARVSELTNRSKYLAGLDDERHTEKPKDDVLRSIPTSTRDADIFNTDSLTRAFADPARQRSELRDRAMRAVELARYGEVDRAEAQGHIANLLDNWDDDKGSIAQRILITGSPTYKRAFIQTIKGQYLTSAEADAFNRALSLTGASGGFAVPFELDATILPTSNGAVNAIRQLARVIQITGDEWRGVSSGAITTAYAAEATETTDNAPTLAQPTISTEKAQAFIPFSIEVGMDWPSLQAEMGRLLQDSKDELESIKFTTGTGTNEPFGYITGFTNTVNATAAGVFDLEDLYRLMGTLPPRYRPRASFVGNLDILNKIRQFDTAGGAALWETLGNSLPNQLVGRPVYENSSASAVTSVGALFLTYADFSRYVIIDRIGLSIELIQHLVGTNHRPTGQRGLYAFWRNGAKVVDANAGRVLIGLA